MTSLASRHKIHAVNTGASHASTTEHTHTHTHFNPNAFLGDLMTTLMSKVAQDARNKNASDPHTTVSVVPIRTAPKPTPHPVNVDVPTIRTHKHIHAHSNPALPQSHSDNSVGSSPSTTNNIEHNNTHTQSNPSLPHSDSDNPVATSSCLSNASATNDNTHTHTHTRTLPQPDSDNPASALSSASTANNNTHTHTQTHTRNNLSLAESNSGDLLTSLSNERDKQCIDQKNPHTNTIHTHISTSSKAAFDEPIEFLPHTSALTDAGDYPEVEDLGLNSVAFAVAEFVDNSLSASNVTICLILNFTLTLTLALTFTLTLTLTLTLALITDRYNATVLSESESVCMCVCA